MWSCNHTLWTFWTSPTPKQCYDLIGIDLWNISISTICICFLSSFSSVFVCSLETTLRYYSCLTVGDTIMVPYNDKKYYIDIVEAKPSPAVSVIETDCEVDFAPPIDYKEFEKPTPSLHSNKRPLEGNNQCHGWILIFEYTNDSMQQMTSPCIFQLKKSCQEKSSLSLSAVQQGAWMANQLQCLSLLCLSKIQMLVMKMFLPKAILHFNRLERLESLCLVRTGIVNRLGSMVIGPKMKQQKYVVLY